MNTFSDHLQADIADCMLRDRHALRRRLGALRKRLATAEPGAVQASMEQLAGAVKQSKDQRSARRRMLPKPDFDPLLPINQRREAIAEAISSNQVVIVCGETGSGKTTQLPKICLQLGLGTAGMIGHTQPRRIAARSVAARIASELHSELGGLIGYKVRFSDRLGPNTLVKLMTDGILLAETQHDRFLNQYEVIIVDEAHERSLNIDFLLGYLHKLLPKRPDLKVIITSATIDPERFSRHFFNAPIIEVSGRSYPVEIRYRPLLAENEDERDRDLQQAILDAVDELTAIDRGDILIFLSGEREIRETRESLRKHKLPGCEIIPLYARLSAGEQNRVFQPGGKRRIVLATNVAETSLTVPGIRYVIDAGQARISRYSHRSKIQRLPVEAISQASAAQRAGRCGRLAPGICIRLYSEEDFLARPAFTEPEILRTNLAAVILQMCTLRLGDVEKFPFIDAPDRRLISDGFKLLFELQAVDGQRRVSELGRRLAKLPVDPRLARMVLAAQDHGCLQEVLVIASALAIQDPRERPLERQQAADQKHRRFSDDKSDFLSLLALWNYFHEQARHLSKSKLRKLCQEDFLSYVRMREWHDLAIQLGALAGGKVTRASGEPAPYAALHKALLSGLLSNVGVLHEEHTYLGARGRKFNIFPGSALFRKSPPWLMAAELVETRRVYARTVARIYPEWIEQQAPHLVKRSYSAAHWEKRAGQVAARERVTLYGLPIILARKINYGPIDPVLAREIFIADGLVAQNINSKAPFLQHNRKQIGELASIEDKTRRRDLLVEEQVLYDFYDQRIPQGKGLYNLPRFERWRKRIEKSRPRLLFFDRDLLLQQELPADTDHAYPDYLDNSGLRLPLSYRFDPRADDDGVTMRVPLAALNQIDPQRLEWLVPGLLRERMAALLKSLPKALRKHFVPVPNYVDALFERMTLNRGSLIQSMRAGLKQITGVDVPDSAWNLAALPDYLKIRIVVLGPDGEIVACGRDLESIQKSLRSDAESTFAALQSPQFERSHVNDWDFGDLPGAMPFERNGITLTGYPALSISGEGSALCLRLWDSEHKAEQAHHLGVRRLLANKMRSRMKNLKREMPDLLAMSLHYMSIGSQADLVADLSDAIIDWACFAGARVPRTRDDFEACLQRGRAGLSAAAEDVCALAKTILGLYQQLRFRLGGDNPAAWNDALADIEDQLSYLVYPGFISATAGEWLSHYPRYLNAIALRLDKLRYGSEKDRQRMAAISPLWLDCKTRLAANTEKGLSDPRLEKFRWMVEELRVSQFAQELKTIEPVSVKRLEKQLRDVA